MAKNPTIPAAYLKARVSPAYCVADFAEMLDTFQPALVAAFVAANGKATSFTLNYDDAIHTAVEAETMLAAKGVPLALRGGSSITITGSGPGANAYKYAARSTRYTLTRDTRGSWNLTSVARCDVHPKQSRRELLTVSEAARDAIVRHALDGIAVQPQAAQVAA